MEYNKELKNIHDSFEVNEWYGGMIYNTLIPVPIVYAYGYLGIDTVSLETPKCNYPEDNLYITKNIDKNTPVYYKNKLVKLTKANYDFLIYTYLIKNPKSNNSSFVISYSNTGDSHNSR